MEPLKPAYDTMGEGYRSVRIPDPRIASQIHAALGNSQTVINVGAGAGSYEPTDRWVLAAEPSGVMIGQRSPGSSPAIVASAESLPLADQSVDAAMAVLTVQHWHDFEGGMAELLRVTRQCIVIATMDVPTLSRLWILADYLPDLIGFHTDRFPSIGRICDLLSNPTVQTVPLASDCTDRFLAALWARPRDLLDPHVRAATSPWYDLPSATVNDALTRLRSDLSDGTWQRKYGDLLANSELDVGFRVITGVV